MTSNNQNQEPKLINLKDFELWLESPVTQSFLDLVKEHGDAAKLAVSEECLNILRLKDLDTDVMSEYRGNYFTCQAILDINTFMQERVKLEEMKHD